MAMDIAENLDLQLSELQMLESMYPDELQHDDSTAATQIQAYVDGNIPYSALDARVGFTIKLSLEKIPIELSCYFPHNYPSVIPSVFLRSTSFENSVMTKFNEDLKRFVDSITEGDLYINQIIEWLQEASMKYVMEHKELLEKQSCAAKSPSKKTDLVFARLWIYSHHIYNKTKRKSILEFSHELNLTGFSMPGKPGMIVIEGYKKDVEEFWYRIRSMNWQRICLKKQTELQCKDISDIEDHRKFESFQEMAFAPKSGGGGRGTHMDLGMLFTFLKSKGFEEVFELYFGVPGQEAK